MLTSENTVLLIIDVQGKLAQSMDEKKALFTNLQKLIQGAKALDIPIIWLEQNPEKLGQTIPEIAGHLRGNTPISKCCFSCTDSPFFMKKLRSSKRRQVLIAGIEAHVCVYQTAVSLLDLGYEVQVVVDAVSSRTAVNKTIALEKIKAVGGDLTSVETALFEMIKTSEGPVFKKILEIVK